MSATRPTPATPKQHPPGLAGSVVADAPAAAGAPSAAITPAMPVVPAPPAALALPAGPAPAGAAPPAALASPESASWSISGNKLCATCGGKYPDDFNVCPRDATPLTWGSADSDPMLGTTLAETYRVLRVLGEGGMGRVYEVQHTRLSHRRFALKMLHGEYARNADIVSRFQREATAASKVTHANIIEVCDVGRAPDGRPYLVTELLEGEELGGVIKRLGKLGVPMAVRVVRQACRGLIAAHALNVVHRDMKPENLFLVGDPARPLVKVIDFGISKIGDHQGTHLTRTGMIIGTPAYMAPEQARGERVDARADVYATGAILYRLLTGRTPFDTDDASAALTAVLTQQPPRPRALSTDIPEALEMIIERAMAKSPDERFSTVAELEQALAPFDASGGERDGAGGDGAEGDGGSGSAGGAGGTLKRDAGGAIVDRAAASARDGAAPTLLAAPRRPPTGELARATREAQLARPSIVLGSLLLGGALVMALCDAIGGAVLLVTREAALSQVNAVLVLAGVLATGITPVVLYGRFVWQKVWGSSVKAVELSRRTRAAAAVGLSVYGALALGARFFADVLAHAPAEIAWPGWSVLFLVCSSCAAAVAAMLSGKDQ
jgi:hypothetical protein